MKKPKPPCYKCPDFVPIECRKKCEKWKNYEQEYRKSLKEINFKKSVVYGLNDEKFNKIDKEMRKWRRPKK